jgi:serine/threonine protein kinase
MSDNQQISDFFQRIKERRLASHAVPMQLQGLIQSQDLHNIYGHVIANKQQLKTELKKGKPFRLDKSNTGLARTLNFIVDFKTGEIELILETKSKNELNQKNPNTKVFSGSFKSTKAAWRIDSAIPKKMANAVFYVERSTLPSKEKREKAEEASLAEAVTETAFAQSIIQKNPGKNTFINCPVLGEVVNKTGLRKSHKTLYVKKISFYSKWAQYGNLTDFLKTNEAKSLSFQQLSEMARELVIAVKAVHDAGVIHQDIKTDNILVSRDEFGQFHLELADFGMARDTNDPDFSEEQALGSLMNESPEISLANKDPKAFYHAYYYNMNYASYGREIAQQINVLPEYAIPNKANDMWSLGVVIYILYYKTIPSSANQSQFSPLIAGLLQPNRQNRFTADEALTQSMALEVQALEAVAKTLAASEQAAGEQAAKEQAAREEAAREEAAKEEAAREEAAREQAQAQNQETDAQKAVRETMVMLEGFKGFYPGYKSTEVSPEPNRKMSRFHALLDWIGVGAKKTKIF